MSRIYITGHRNPDLDSICSALSYAVLKNLIDPLNEYVAVRCSHLSDEMKSLLDTLKIIPPPYHVDISPKVSDVMLTETDRIDAAAPLTAFVSLYRKNGISAVPVFEGELFRGLLSTDDVAVWALNELSDHDNITDIPCVGEIIGAQTESLDIDTPFDEAKRILQNSASRGLSVVHSGQYAGFVTRNCFLNRPRHNVILVDHNEPGQSIRGIEDANIIEIIDHHRLNAVKTDIPLFIDAEPLGSTCTIVYQLYLRNGIRPDRHTAQCLLTGILSDTLILKSPTSTHTDRESAAFLAAICGLDVNEYGQKIFSSLQGLNFRDPEKAILSDFKQYTEQAVRIGIGQCEVTTLKDLSIYHGSYMEALEAVRKSMGLDWALLMITDIIEEHSVLLSTAYEAADSLQYPMLCRGLYDMPHVLSRKKQLLPEILHTLDIQ